MFLTLIFSGSLTFANHRPEVLYPETGFKLSLTYLRSTLYSQINNNPTYIFKTGLIPCKTSQGQISCASISLKNAWELSLPPLEVYSSKPVLKDGQQAVESKNSFGVDFTGDEIRKAVVEGMKQLKSQEDEITLELEVEILLKKKNYIFFDSSESLTKAKIFIIPSSIQWDALYKVNTQLNLQDPKGLKSTLKIEYLQNRTPQKIIDQT